MLTMYNYSPLRYPGGKSKLSPFIKVLLQNLDQKKTKYIEPFAGGAGVALTLLLEGVVDDIVINDYDKAIYSFWRSVIENPIDLIDKIEQTPVTMEEWQKQKRIYCASTSYSMDLAFATLFLNRTNRSGILTAGPIGGYAQDGEWKLDVRFNKKSIISRIERISEHSDNIRVYNKDVVSLIKNYMPKFDGDLFIYFDPPYYNKGQKLYKNYFTPDDHRIIQMCISREITSPWLITYDDVDAIRELYKDYLIKKFDLRYSVANKGVASELMIFSDAIYFPTESQLVNNNIGINLRN